MTFIPAINDNAVLYVEYDRNPKPFKPERVVEISEPLPQTSPAVKIDLGVDPPLTRHQRRKRGIKLVGMRYSAARIGRNEYVSVDDGPRVKFKRTGVYREARR